MRIEKRKTTAEKKKKRPELQFQLDYARNKGKKKENRTGEKETLSVKGEKKRPNYFFFPQRKGGKKKKRRRRISPIFGFAREQGEKKRGKGERKEKKREKNWSLLLRKEKGRKRHVLARKRKGRAREKREASSFEGRGDEVLRALQRLREVGG